MTEVNHHSSGTLMRIGVTEVNRHSSGTLMRIGMTMAQGRNGTNRAGGAGHQNSRRTAR